MVRRTSNGHLIGINNEGGTNESWSFMHHHHASGNAADDGSRPAINQGLHGCRHVPAILERRKTPRMTFTIDITPSTEHHQVVASLTVAPGRTYASVGQSGPDAIQTLLDFMEEDLETLEERVLTDARDILARESLRAFFDVHQPQ